MFSPLQKNFGSIIGFPGAQPTDNNLLEADCDILVPAAGEQQITAEIAENIKAKVIAIIQTNTYMYIISFNDWLLTLSL